MHLPPANLHTSQQAHALEDYWRPCVVGMTYVVGGFGSHHWDVRSETREDGEAYAPRVAYAEQTLLV